MFVYWYWRVRKTDALANEVKLAVGVHLSSLLWDADVRLNNLRGNPTNGENECCNQPIDLRHFLLYLTKARRRTIAIVTERKQDTLTQMRKPIERKKGQKREVHHSSHKFACVVRWHVANMKNTKYNAVDYFGSGRVRRWLPWWQECLLRWKSEFESLSASDHSYPFKYNYYIYLFTCILYLVP